MNGKPENIIKTEDGELYQISGVWDDPTTYDRYTVTFKTWDKKQHKWVKIQEANSMVMCLCLSENCNSVQGVNMFSVCEEGSHLGKKLQFETLPCLIQNAIISRIEK